MAKEILLHVAILFAASEIFAFFLMVVLQPFKKGQTTFSQDLKDSCGKIAVLFGGMIILPIIMVYYLVDYLISKTTEPS